MAPLLTVPLTLSIYISRRRSGCCWRLRGDGGVTSVQRTGSCGAAVRRCRVSPRVVTVAGLDTSTSPHPARATRRTRAAAVSYTLTRFCTLLHPAAARHLQRDPRPEDLQQRLGRAVKRLQAAVSRSTGVKLTGSWAAAAAARQPEYLTVAGGGMWRRAGEGGDLHHGEVE